MASHLREAFSHFVVFTELHTNTKEAVFRELLEAAVKADRLHNDELDELLCGWLSGEVLYSQLSGKGVACTHALRVVDVADHLFRDEQLLSRISAKTVAYINGAPSGPIMVIGRSRAALDLDAPDGMPIHVVALLLGRDISSLECGAKFDTPLVAGVLRLLCVERFHSRVMAAQNLSDVAEALDERCRDHLRSALERTGSLIELRTGTKEGVLRELVHALANARLFSQEHVDELVEGLFESERLGSTGFGKGIAMPRTRHPEPSEVIIGIGRSREGVEFNALDRAPVHIFAPILAPRNVEEQKVVLEYTMFCYLADGGFRRRIRNGQNLSDVLRAIEKC